MIDIISISYYLHRIEASFPATAKLGGMQVGMRFLYGLGSMQNGLTTASPKKGGKLTVHHIDSQLRLNCHLATISIRVWHK